MLIKPILRGREIVARPEIEEEEIFTPFFFVRWVIGLLFFPVFAAPETTQTSNDAFYSHRD